MPAHPFGPFAEPSRTSAATLWLFAAAVVAATALAPPRYRPFTVAVDVLLAGALACWAAGRIAGRRRPHIPWPLAAAAGFLVALGWAMALNAHSAYHYDAQTGGSFRPTVGIWAGGPGSADGPESVRVMVRVTLLLAATCVAADLAATAPAFCRRWLVVVAFAGAGVAALGLVARAAFPDLLAGAFDPHEGTPFGTFNYHANAGAFMNLCLPAALALIPPPRGATASRGEVPRRKKAWLAFGLVVAAAAVGAAVNVSKASLPLSAAAVAVVVWVALRGRTGQVDAAAATSPRRWWRRAAVILAAAVVALAGTVVVARVGGQWDRWAEYARQPNPLGGRGVLWRIVADLAADAGPWGHGPGTYKLLFPLAAKHRPEIYPKFIVTVHAPGGPVSMWSQAHEDYLQAVVEWGWVGAAVAGVVFLGGLARGVVLLRLRAVSAASSRGPPARSDPRAVDGYYGDVDGANRTLLLAATIGLAGVAIHAAFDFPLQVPAVQVVAAVYVGCLWGVGRARGGTRGPASRSPHGSAA